MEVTDKTRADVKVHWLALLILLITLQIGLNDHSNETSLGVLSRLHCLGLYKPKGFHLEFG